MLGLRASDSTWKSCMAVGSLETQEVICLSSQTLDLSHPRTEVRASMAKSRCRADSSRLEMSSNVLVDFDA